MTRLTLLAALLLTAPTTLHANEGSRLFYGMGVHHYFSGEYEEALAAFAMAVEYDKKDVRCHFLKGLAQYKLKDAKGCRATFDQAAKLEVEYKESKKVGRALERIQGAPRLLIETYRKRARSKKLSEKEA